MVATGGDARGPTEEPRVPLLALESLREGEMGTASDFPWETEALKFIASSSNGAGRKAEEDG